MFCADTLLLWSDMSREKMQEKSTQGENHSGQHFLVNERLTLLYQ